ncbi:MAG: serine hydrolase [bacterium]|nr:serine hydrolase [bacterium]
MPTKGKKFLFLLLFITVFWAGFFISQNTSFITRGGSDCDNNFPLLNQAVVCDFSEEKNLEAVQSLEIKTNDLISSLKKEGKISRVSVFFRDLSSKKWFGISQNEKYAPASLLKLPMIMAYYKLSEIDPDLFSKKYIFKKIDPLFSQDIEPKVRLEEGKEYTIEEILQQMIVFSDNSAMDFLMDMLDQNFMEREYYNLGIIFNGGQEDYLSPIIYSNILRMLYNSSYLTRNSSEKILGLLSETDFNNGLVSGVPAGITVAHKFGERDIDAATKEFHDCGIIYPPGHPYILCVMTTGDNYSNLEKFISDVSRLAYEEIKN